MQPLDQISEARRALVRHLKSAGAATLAELAQHLGLTTEAVRQQLLQLERDGWVGRVAAAREEARRGRPPARYALTAAAEHLFPKDYAALAVALIDAVASLGPDAVQGVLTTVTEARLQALQASVAHLPPEDLEARVAALRDVYVAGDPFLEVERIEGGYRLVERNCPFLDVAMARPALCSSTVSVMSRLLGRRVVRRERFQWGHGRCVFEVYEDQPAGEAGERFVPEPETEPVGPDGPPSPPTPARH